MNMHEGNTRRHLTGVIAAAALLAAFPAFANSTGSLPAELHEGSVAYVTGGIGRDQSMAFKRAASSYPLEIELLKKTSHGNAEYLADDHVVIRNHDGKAILDTKASGPFVLVRVAPGRYTVSASDNGKMKVRHVQLAENRHERLVFEW